MRRVTNRVCAKTVNELVKASLSLAQELLERVGWKVLVSRIDNVLVVRYDGKPAPTAKLLLLLQ